MTETLLVWKRSVSPVAILRHTTVVTVFVYCCFLAYVLTYNTGGEPTPSMSRMIAFSKGTTITFTLMVLLHGYTLMSYLVIASEYIGAESWQIYFLTIASVAYWLCLLIVTYIPMDGNENPHNVFAVGGFLFALFTVYLHKHSFINTDKEMCGIIDIAHTERRLVLYECIMILTITILGGLFWTYDVVFAEYIFVGLIIVDKYFKVAVLEESGLLNLENAALEYRYYSPANNPQTGVARLSY